MSKSNGSGALQRLVYLAADGSPWALVIALRVLVSLTAIGVPRFTASDVASGNGNVVAAEYFLGATGPNGSGTPMAVNLAASTVCITASVPAPAASAASAPSPASAAER